MAVVRISQRMIEECRYKIRQGFDLRRKPLMNAYQEKVAEVTPALQRAYVRAMLDKHGVTQAQLDAVRGFTRKTATVALSCINDVRLVGALYLRWNPPIPHAEDMGSAVKHPEFDEVANALRPKVQALEALDTEEAACISQVKRLLDSCTTLKQALDIWPELVGVLPQEYIDRHNEKVERSKPVPPQVTIDGDALTSSVIRNKLASAGGMGTP